MNNIYIILFLGFCLILFSCEKKVITTEQYYDITHYKSKKVEGMSQVELISVKIDSTIESSFEGEFWICNDTLCFTDSYFNYVFWFSNNGNLLKQQVGKGKGPNEVINCMYSLPLQEEFCLLNIGNSDLYSFNLNGKRKKKGAFRLES